MALGKKTGGRKQGTPNKATAEVRELAQDYGPDALAELARLSKESDSDAARVSACNALLDRAYGKAPTSRPVKIDLPDVTAPEGVVEAMAAILRAVAKAEISPAEARDLAALVEGQRRAIETVDLAERMDKLEAALEGRDGRK